MSHTDQSKPLSQSDELWFKKSNYPDKWLSAKSKEIINKIKQKQMKNLIFTLLLPLMSFGQLDFDKAFAFQNDVRNMYGLEDLKHDDSLSESANVWANYLAETNSFEFSEDDKGELIYTFDKSMLGTLKDYIYDASMAWALSFDTKKTFNQITCNDCNYVGFGIAENKDYIYVVARYDKIYK